MRVVVGFGVLCAGLLVVSPEASAAATSCGCEAKLCEVKRSEDLEACGRGRVLIHGELKRFPMRKGKRKPWQATGLFLADGTRIVVTYGQPPAQWDRFVGKRVCVRAKVVSSSPLHPSSVSGPHLSEWDFPVLSIKKGGAMKAKRAELVTLTGTAEDAKGGAVLVTADDGVYYLAGLDAWPDAVHGKRVQVEGRLSRRQYIPEAKKSKDGAWSQGAVGKQDVIEAPTWRLVQ